MTIVGDLKQISTGTRQFSSWDELGFDIPAGRRHKLVKNYRWSKRVYQFLQLFKRVAGIDEELYPPRTWYAGEGVQPEIRKHETRDDELEFVAARILNFKDGGNSEHTTVAVIVPGQLVEVFRASLIGKLRSYAVNVRWASGLEVTEGVDYVIVTDYESIVGLEFDCVFLVGAEAALQRGSAEEKLSIWVAITRPRTYLCVTYVGNVSLFDHPELKHYH
jgi:superfamily I DNA/RNA helicase